MKLRAGNPMLKSVFDKALRADLPIDAQQIIRRQHNSLRESRDRVRRMQQEMSYSEAGGMMQSIGDTGRRSMEAVSQQFTKNSRWSARWWRSASAW